MIGPPTHWWFYMVYVSDQIVALCETGRGQLVGCREYWMGRLRGLMSDSDLRGGSPRPCRLRTDRLALMSKFDCVLTHTRYMGSRKLSSFDGHRVGRSLTSPVVMYTGIVYGPPMDNPACGIAWKTYTREMCDPTRLFDRCRELWPLVVPSWPTCVMLSGYFPC
jgi:hypothetical protein